MNIVDRALEIATEAHKGVFRWDGKTPYIEHPKAVADLAIKLLLDESYASTVEEYESLSGTNKVLVELIKIVSYAHDLVEDVDKYINKEKEFVDELFKNSEHDLKNVEAFLIIDSLKRLNKHRHSDYLEFVLSAKEKMISRIVKTADLQHNLSDMKAKGSLSDKYKLALYILTHV